MTIITTASAASQAGRGSRVAGRGTTVTHFTHLDVWKVAHELTLKTFKWTSEFPSEDKFNLVSQMQKAAVSIESNIAEGFGRFSPADKKHFYTMARGSCFELESQLLISKDLQKISDEKGQEGSDLCERVRHMLNGLIQPLRSLPSPTTRHPSPDSSHLL